MPDTIYGQRSRDIRKRYARKRDAAIAAWNDVSTVARAFVAECNGKMYTEVQQIDQEQADELEALKMEMDELTRLGIAVKKEREGT